MRWVNSVVESHFGLAIDELRVIFDLDVSYESDIDKWLVFALAKNVKRLELDFTPQIGRCFSLIDCYTWPLECRLSSLGLHRNLVSLRSLCLKYVNVTEKDIECVLLSCHALEKLCIVNGSIYLKNINLPQTSLQLKHLELSCCYHLLCIDIKAPKLVSFTLHGRPIALHIRESSLSEVSIGNGDYSGEVVAFAYESLSQYLSKLEYLSWHLLLSAANNVQWNMGISKPPIMSNLKHLELHVKARGDESLLGWAYLIEASPVLQKLTMKFSRSSHDRFSLHLRNIVKHKGRPLTNLKTLEHFGFLGLPIDIEFATYVVENSIKLKDVIFTHPRITPFPNPITKYAADRVLEFKMTLPKDVAFKFGKAANHCCPISTYPYF